MESCTSNANPPTFYVKTSNQCRLSDLSEIRGFQTTLSAKRSSETLVLLY
ncbi:hypothetical protein [Neisseria mucosa]|nr:hypothetical protein [Neisseria mucosa]